MKQHEGNLDNAASERIDQITATAHTEGPISVDPTGDVGDWIIGNGDLMVAECHEGDDDALNAANARRLVACWNACDGMPTSLLEHSTFGSCDAAVSHEILVELIEALCKLVAHHRELIAAGFGDDTAIRPALALLAKHQVELSSGQWANAS